MPVVVVTEGDIAGIDADSKAHFSIESVHHKLHYIIPLSLLRESFNNYAKKEECLSLIKSSCGDQIYDILKKAVLEKDIAPTIAVTDEHRNWIAEGLKTCPPWIARVAEAAYIKAIIVKNDTEIKSNSVRYKGMSTGKGIFLKLGYLPSTSLVREEMVHEVETIARDSIRSPKFSQSKEFIAAMSQDIQKGQETNGIYRYLVDELPVYLQAQLGGKKNLALYPNRNLFNFGEKMHMNDLGDYLKELKTYSEALPDLYAIAAMVDEKIANNKEDWHATREEIMRQAFPNSWQLVNGAAEGKKLVQYRDGKIEEIDKEALPPQNAEPVLSFKECCEVWLENQEKGILEEELPLCKVTLKTPKRKKAFAEQEKAVPAAERLR